MKRACALLLAGVILFSGFMVVSAEASTSADALMNKVVDKVMKEKREGNTLYYDLIVGYKDSITKETLASLYNMLSKEDKARVRNELGEGITDDEVMQELKNLTTSDIDKIKREIEKMAPSSEGAGGHGSDGGNPALNQGGAVVPNPLKPVENAGEYQHKILFTDIDNLWNEAKDAIVFMVERGVLLGKGEKTFAPHDSITRAEFVKTIVALFQLKNDNYKPDKSFTDVQKEHWYYDYVRIAFQYGIINGCDTEHFAPNALITREEMTVMVTRTIQAMDRGQVIPPIQVREIISTYNDFNTIEQWSEESLALAIKNGIIKGKEGNMLSPKDNATRAEAIVILKRVFNFLNK